MTKLQRDWLTEGNLDFEYKKYVLLAYLQHVQSQFTAHRLFPHLPELRSHYESSLYFNEKKKTIRSAFPKNLTGLDLKKLRLQYEEVYNDDACLSELNSILEFAIPRFSSTLSEGQERFQEVEAELTFAPVGIIPLRTEEGYLFIHRTSQHETAIFRYQLALYDSGKQRYIHTVWVDSITKGLGTTFENLKVELARKYRSLPNPATYMVETRYDYPLHETLLPVAKQLMVRYLNVA
ncbi:hypothetical protein [Telluribacter sp.]|jgi:hypothetical protein|uniref:hypothetical protein n=1 Tax=Telluribacter sp. TaxID=1978767 RepID=UPI002E143863|nr:hypothetical protein [Telluribacter sp.]